MSFEVAGQSPNGEQPHHAKGHDERYFNVLQMTPEQLREEIVELEADLHRMDEFFHSVKDMSSIGKLEKKVERALGNEDIPKEGEYEKKCQKLALLKAELKSRIPEENIH